MSAALLAPALERLAAALEREPRARVSIDRCRELFLAHCGHDPADEPDPRRALAQALAALEESGRVRLPARRSRHLWEEERSPALPAYVLRAGAPRPRAAARPPLHPVLALAQERAGTAALPSGVDRLDAWLRSASAGAPVAPLQERSYEIFGDEKRLGALLATRFALEGGLSHASFRAYRVSEPFVVSEVAPGADWAIAVENLATYDSVRRATCGPAGRAPERGAPAAVIYGRGNHFTASCASLPERLPSVRRLVYFGDLDPRGLRIPLAVRAALPGLEVAPWHSAYNRLLTFQPSRHRRPADPAEAARLAAFLPEELRGAAEAVLRSGCRLPQEAVGRAAIEELLRDLVW
jgi:hypothetical protein